jgi:hypothetical protein
MIMDRIQADLMEILGTRATDVQVLSREAANNLATMLRESFGNPKSKADPLWESLNYTDAYHAEEADAEVERQVLGLQGPVHLLVDDWYGYSALKLLSGAQLWYVLEKSYNFCWYATDDAVTHLLCKNDHNVFLVCRDPTPKTNGTTVLEGTLRGPVQ